MESLPNEIIAKITGNINWAERMDLCLVSKRWAAVIRDNKEAVVKLKGLKDIHTERGRNYLGHILRQVEPHVVHLELSELPIETPRLFDKFFLPPSANSLLSQQKASAVLFPKLESLKIFNCTVDGDSFHCLLHIFFDQNNAPRLRTFSWLNVNTEFKKMPPRRKLAVANIEHHQQQIRSALKSLQLRAEQQQQNATALLKPPLALPSHVEDSSVSKKLEESGKNLAARSPEEEQSPESFDSPPGSPASCSYASIQSDSIHILPGSRVPYYHGLMEDILIQHLPTDRLEHVHLSNYRVTGPALVDLCKKIGQKLQTLTVNRSVGPDRFHDKQYVHEAIRCLPNLRIFSLSTAANDELLEALAAHCPRLESVSFHGFKSKLTARALDAFRTLNPGKHIPLRIHLLLSKPIDEADIRAAVNRYRAPLVIITSNHNQVWKYKNNPISITSFNTNELD